MNDESSNTNIQSDVDNPTIIYLQQIHESIGNIEKRLTSSTKDRWDKAGIIAQFLSGTVIALIGLLISSSVNNAQRASADRQQLVEYLKYIGEASDMTRRAALIGALDLAIPKDAVRIASSYALNDPSQSVREQAIRVLAKFPNGKLVLERIARSSVFPDKQLAEMGLGYKVKELLIRLSDIDDDGHLMVNGSQVVEIGLGKESDNDSGWVDITKNLQIGRNSVEFRLHNGPFGGWSGRLQMSAGEFQYDSTTLLKNACPCNADAFQISVGVVIGKDGNIEEMSAEPPVYY